MICTLLNVFIGVETFMGNTWVKLFQIEVSSTMQNGAVIGGGATVQHPLGYFMRDLHSFSKLCI